MKKRWAYAIQIALLLSMISGLIIGCEGLSSAPPASEYPADIIGRVTIAEKVMVEGEQDKSFGGNIVYWIVEVSVKNKNYERPINSKYDPSIPLPKDVSVGQVWSIIVNGKVWATPIFDSPPITVPQGQSGNMIFSFAFQTDDDTKVSDTQISYRGQEPFYYGELINGDTVAVYDWDLKKVTQAQVSQENVATVKSIRGVTDLLVELHPTNHTVANKVYVVDLYEKGNFRARTKVSWNQPEINVSSMKLVSFPLTWEEEKAYRFKDVSHIFSVKVHE